MSLEWCKNLLGTFISKPPSVIELLERIRASQFRQKRNEYFDRLKYKCLYLVITVFLLCFFQCHTRIYNSWFGPFQLTRDEFITHWNIYSGNVSRERTLLSGLFSLDKEYMQIELGEDKINMNLLSILKVYYRHPTYGKVLYTFHRIKDQNITSLPMELFIKLPAKSQPHFHKRLPYRFELFNSDTLKCIAKQLDIHSNVEDLMHIKLIEEIYDQNATDFNIKVIAKCGILLGYIYDCEKETVFSAYSKYAHEFAFLTAAFDASCSYSAYMSYLFGSVLLSWCLTRLFGDLFQYLSHVLVIPQPSDTLDVQDALERFNIDSVRTLDYLILATRKENTYRNQLFFILDEYLIIFKIKLNERNPKILCQFNMTMPFIIVDIASITAISSDHIRISDRFSSNRIPLPKVDNNNSNLVDWVHGRLMYYSANYRLNYRVDQLRQQQDAIRIQEEQRRRRLAVLINEEEDYQRIHNENDFERIWNRTTSASPRFIAQFRLEGAQTVNSQLCETTCTICLETLKLNEHYSQWPCTAQHTFHYTCMLNVLRRQNVCPLCRDAVEAADLQPTDTVFQIFLSTVGRNVTN